MPERNRPKWPKVSAGHFAVNASGKWGNQSFLFLPDDWQVKLARERFDGQASRMSACPDLVGSSPTIGMHVPKHSYDYL